ncbi:MAG: UDP-N-acetylmuramate--L-alanine ligase [Candidatus Omnitrophota bacterium]
MKKIHFIGIGGIGMSGLARIAMSRGIAVSGSDLRLNALAKSLMEQGAEIFSGHSAGNITRDVDLVVRSSCITDSNPEIAAAREKGIKTISRGEFLKYFLDSSPVSVTVTGTHGKTTTSALIAHIAESAGKKPISVIGGEVPSLGTNAKYGTGEIIISEVDESDGFFRNISSTYGVVTNIEREHMDHYGSMENLIDAYKAFISRISPSGIFFYSGEDLRARELSLCHKGVNVDYGIGGGYEVTCRNFSYARSIELDFYMSGRNYGRIKAPNLIGRHNVMNILAAVSVSLTLGIDFEILKEALLTFRGVRRRFDIRGKIGSIEVVEDYAHHPTEIAAVLRAAKDYTRGRVVAVFQPHRYSRTHDLAESFMGCFDDSDVLILTDVYSADESPVNGKGVLDIYNGMDKNKFEIFEYLNKIDIPGYLSKVVKENDVILILGAGDIREISGEVILRIQGSVK